METTYGIGVKNRYQLFCDDEDDPLEILRRQEEENQKLKSENLSKDSKGKGTKSAVLSKGTRDVAPKGKINTEQGFNKPRSARPGPDRSVRFSNNATQDDSKESEERRNRRNRDDRPFSDTRAQQKGEAEIRRRGGMRGARGGRGRGGMGFDNRGKREFDRQSGSDKSGVKPVEKREGAGAHNWGTVKDDLDDENPDVGERSGDEVPFEQTETKDGEPGNVPKFNDANNEMTLDEWKRQQAGIRSKASFNLRKAGEGEDSTQWKKCYVLKKKLGEDDDDEEEEDSEDDDENGRRGRQKQFVDIKINFADSRRARGRGRGARGAGRGGPKGTKSAEQSVPKVDDWNDFPSLIAA